MTGFVCHAEQICHAVTSRHLREHCFFLGYEVEVEENEPAEETTSHQPKVEEDAQNRSTAEGVEVPGEQMNSGEAAGDQEGQQNHGQHQSGVLSSGTLPPPVRRRTKLLTRRIRNPELKWREHILRKYNLKQLPIHDYKWPETHIKISRTTYMRTGKAMAFSNVTFSTVT